MDVGVLTGVAVLLTAAAVRAIVSAARKRGEWLGRRGRSWWAVTLVLATLVAWYVEVGHHQRQQLASEALQVLSRNPDARAECQRFTEAIFNLSQYDGFVYHDNPDVAVLRREVCADLSSYARGGHANPTHEQIAAVHLIAHESMHIEGVWNEAEAECIAVQQSHLVAEFLGASPEQARVLQARYFERLYPYMRTDYRSPECREGGDLDLFPDRTEFP